MQKAQHVVFFSFGARCKAGVAEYSAQLPDETFPLHTRRLTAISESCENRESEDGVGATSRSMYSMMGFFDTRTLRVMPGFLFLSMEDT